MQDSIQLTGTTCWDLSLVLTWTSLFGWVATSLSTNLLFYTGKHILWGCTVDLWLCGCTVAPLVWHCTLPLQGRWGSLNQNLVSPCLDMLWWLLLSQFDKLTLDHRHHTMHILRLPINWHEFIERGNDSKNLLLSVRLDSSNVDSLSEVISQL